MTKGPLSSLKILDFSTLLPGPFATMMLSDLGADVLCIEGLPSKNKNDKLKTPPSMREYLGRSKNSLGLNLKEGSSREIIKRLLKNYDIVVEQFRPGVMKRLGLDYEKLSIIHPSLIYCSITGFGQTGPYRDRAGHDINYLSLCGVSSYSGVKGEGPILTGPQIADIAGGSFHAITGILASVIHREKTGEGQYIDISMLDGSFSLNSIHGADSLSNKKDLSFESTLLNGGSFYGYYKTKDDRFFSVGSLEPKFFRELCKGLNRKDILDMTLKEENKGKDYIKEEFKKTFKSKTFKEWRDIFSKLDACVEPVLSFQESLNDPHVKERGLIVDVPCGEDGESKKQIGSPFKFSSFKNHYKNIGKMAGHDTKSVLLEAGYTEEELNKFRKQGAIEF